MVAAIVGAASANHLGASRLTQAGLGAAILISVAVWAWSSERSWADFAQTVLGGIIVALIVFAVQKNHDDNLRALQAAQSADLQAIQKAEAQDEARRNLALTLSLRPTLKYSVLSHLDLRDARLTRRDLRFADLSDAQLAGVSAYRPDLRYANLRDVRAGVVTVADARIAHARLIRAHFSGAHLGGVHGEDVVATQAHLEGARMTRARLPGLSARGAFLTGASLRGAHLVRAALDHADVRWADLDRAVLARASLSATDLEGADLRGAVLCGTTWDPRTPPIVRGATYDRWTQLPPGIDVGTMKLVTPPRLTGDETGNRLRAIARLCPDGT